MRYALAILILALFPLQVQATSTDAYCLGSYESRLLGYVNGYRVKNGLNKLKPSQTLGAAARHHALSMARHDYFSHFLIPENRSWGDNIRRHGYKPNTYLGENIAAGNRDPYKTFLQWVNSPVHNALMLDPTWQAIGVGRATWEPSKWDNYWVLNVGGVFDTPARRC